MLSLAVSPVAAQGGAAYLSRVLGREREREKTGLSRQRRLLPVQGPAKALLYQYCIIRLRVNQQVEKKLFDGEDLNDRWATVLNDAVLSWNLLLV